jgi:hypothetical protein
MNDVDASRLRFVPEVAGSHSFRDAAESRAFVQKFSKALVDALVKGDGSMAVYVAGQVHYHDRE